MSGRTRETIVAVSERLGYVPNNSARHLYRAGTGTMGLRVPEVSTRFSYRMSFVSGVVEQAARHNYDGLPCGSPPVAALAVLRKGRAEEWAQRLAMLY